MAGPLLLGIEIGGTKLQLGLGRGDGEILAFERRGVVPRRGAEGIRAQIVDAFAALLRSAGASAEGVEAAGIGFGGPVDSARGVVTKSHQIEGWEGFPLADWARRSLGVPRVALHNDADTAGLAEARFGAGVGCSPLLYVTIGSGIGGGLILDGQIYRGAGAGALEIGHIWVVDRTNTDQDVLKLEDVASGWSIASAARRSARHQLAEGLTGWDVLRRAGGDPDAITTEHVAQAAAAGDAEAGFLLRKAVAAMAHALSQAVTLLAPRRIILGGGVSLIGEALWFAPIRHQLEGCVFPPFRGTFEVVPAALGEPVVVQGALALAADLRRGDSPPA